jgi:hypothetical protein
VAVLVFAGSLAAQPPSGKGSNFDNPTVPIEQPKPVEPPKPEPAKEQPLVNVDWTSSDTLIKIAVLAGALLIGLKAFRQIKS